MFQNGKPFIFNNDEKILEQYNPFSINWKDYQTVETLGSGSDGVVVKLRDSQSQHCIAAKISLNRNNRSEVNTLLMTDHANIIKLIGYEFTQSKRILYLTNFDGFTLESLIIENNGLKMSDLFPIYYQVFNALEYLHNMNIAHMDIKPNNILINKSGKVKLIDFENSLNFSSFPYVKGAIGSYVFGAPEINLDGFYSGLPCDVFSLHLTLGIAVIGKIFWSKAHISEPKYYKWITEKDNSEELNNIDDEMFRFLKRVLVHSPTNRPTLKQVKQDSWFLEMESKFIK